MLFNKECMQNSLTGPSLVICAEDQCSEGVIAASNMADQVLMYTFVCTCVFHSRIQFYLATVSK